MFKRALAVFFVCSGLSVLAYGQNRSITPNGSRLPKKYVEALSGPLAKRHLESISAKRRGVVGKAAEALRKRGWTDTGRVTVQRTILPVTDKSTPLNPAYRLLQSGGSTSADGEIATWEWNDGDYDTWEGTIYLHEYESGTWMSVNCQFWLTEGNEWQEIWSSVVDGEVAPNGPFDLDPVRDRFEFRQQPVLVAALGTPALLPHIADAHVMRVSWEGLRQRFKDWGYCTAFGCAGAFFACNRQNPTPQEKPDVAFCSAAWCIGAGIGCLSNIK